HYIDEETTLRGKPSDSPAQCAIIRGGDHEPDATQPVFLESAGQMLYALLPGEFCKRVGERGRADRDVSVGDQQAFDLALGNHSAADHQHAALSEVGK